MKFSIVIPVRYASTRLPGKPLLDIAGRPMIAHVYERACESGADDIIVATDDQRIADVADRIGAEVCLTSADHSSGTERIAEVVERKNYSDDRIIVNLQGDEPCLPGALLHQVADDLDRHPQADMSTLCEDITSVDAFCDWHVAKVALDQAGYALYFSRAPIPWPRDAFTKDPKALPKGQSYLKHIGVYAYRAGFIKRYVSWPASSLEKTESLEQLRVLWHGGRIHVVHACCDAGVGVDTPEDLEKVRQLFSK